MVACILLCAACTSKPDNPTPVDKLPPIYPDYVGVTIPDGIAPLNLSLADGMDGSIDVVVKGEKGGMLHANGDHADFDIDDWHELTKQNKGDFHRMRLRGRTMEPVS